MKILDSSPVIAFYTELNEPDMLHKFIELGYELRIPRSVFKEIENGRTSEPLKSNIAHGNIEIMASLPEEDIFHFKNRYPYLGYGEIEVILWWLKLDDKKARKIAEKHNVVFTGTIGLIELLLKKQAINKDKREELINKLSSSRFRMKKSF